MQKVLSKFIMYLAAASFLLTIVSCTTQMPESEPEDENEEEEAVIEPDKILWTIGDSIFDLNDNDGSGIPQRIAFALGYERIFRNNISGSTVLKNPNFGVQGSSLVEHLDNNTPYANFLEPDVIIVQRGTNDLTGIYWKDNVGLTVGSIAEENKETAYGALVYSAKRLRERYPDAKIIWSTPIFRADLPDLERSKSEMAAYIEILYTVCALYDIEVFDLHTAVGINETNYQSYLPDKLHPNANGVDLIVQAFIDYLKN